MSRSLKKGPYINEKLITKLQNLRADEKTVIKTWDRGASITPEMVGHRIGIHDGRKHVEVLIVEEMVGHKLGEFAPTRKFTRHGGRMAREEEAAVVAKEAQATKGAQETPAPEEKPVKGGAKGGK